VHTLLAPRSGRPFYDDELQMWLYAKVVIVRRRWSYRVIYEIADDMLTVHRIDPSWKRPLS
jgi:hypothetical protein